MALLCCNIVDLLFREYKELVNISLELICINYFLDNLIQVNAMFRCDGRRIQRDGRCFMRR